MKGLIRFSARRRFLGMWAWVAVLLGIALWWGLARLTQTFTVPPTSGFSRQETLETGWATYLVDSKTWVYSQDQIQDGDMICVQFLVATVSVRDMSGTWVRFAPMQTALESHVGGTGTRWSGFLRIPPANGPAEEAQARRIVGAGLRAEHADPLVVEAIEKGRSAPRVYWRGVGYNAIAIASLLALVLAGAALLRMVFVTGGERREIRRSRGQCPRCGYSMAGLLGANFCPECGEACNGMPRL